MTRRNLLGALATALGAPTLATLAGGRAQAASDPDPKRADRLVLTEAQWRQRLTPDQYHVLRDEGTEPPHSSALNAEKRKGRFVCAGCGLPLFSSEAKYDSGTGWPSFYSPLPNALGTKRDWKLVLPRTEYHCARCGGHQGHVFDDGPAPTGLRYCNNGVALRFEVDK
ncbi:MAG: peptide-methionine (R)-S-oxide reductase MsrB [Burkholderiaceae bacterium]